MSRQSVSDHSFIRRLLLCDGLCMAITATDHPVTIVINIDRLIAVKVAHRLAYLYTMGSALDRFSGRSLVTITTGQLKSIVRE